MVLRPRPTNNTFGALYTPFRRDPTYHDGSTENPIGSGLSDSFLLLLDLTDDHGANAASSAFGRLRPFFGGTGATAAVAGFSSDDDGGGVVASDDFRSFRSAFFGDSTTAAAAATAFGAAAALTGEATFGLTGEVGLTFAEAAENEVGELLVLLGWVGDGGGEAAGGSMTRRGSCVPSSSESIYTDEIGVVRR